VEKTNQITVGRLHKYDGPLNGPDGASTGYELCEFGCLVPICCGRAPALPVQEGRV